MQWVMSCRSCHPLAVVWSTFIAFTVNRWNAIIAWNEMYIDFMRKRTSISTSRRTLWFSIFNHLTFVLRALMYRVWGGGSGIIAVLNWIQFNNLPIGLLCDAAGCLRHWWTQKQGRIDECSIGSDKNGTVLDYSVRSIGQLNSSQIIHVDEVTERIVHRNHACQGISPSPGRSTDRVMIIVISPNRLWPDCIIFE